MTQLRRAASGAAARDVSAVGAADRLEEDVVGPEGEGRPGQRPGRPDPRDLTARATGRAAGRPRPHRDRSAGRVEMCRPAVDGPGEDADHLPSGLVAPRLPVRRRPYEGMHGAERAGEIAALRVALIGKELFDDRLEERLRGHDQEREPGPLGRGAQPAREPGVDGPDAEAQRRDAGADESGHVAGERGRLSRQAQARREEQLTPGEEGGGVEQLAAVDPGEFAGRPRQLAGRDEVERERRDERVERRGHARPPRHRLCESSNQQLSVDSVHDDARGAGP